MTTTGDEEPRQLDPGAQAERTALAWQRTGFGLLAAGALFTHLPHENGFPVRMVCGVVLLIVGALVGTVVPPLRYRRIVRDVGAGRTAAAPLLLLLLALPLVIVVTAMTIATAIR